MKCKNQQKKWSASDEEWLINFYGLKSTENIARFLKRSTGAIRQKAYKLGIQDRLTHTGEWNEYRITSALGVDSHTISRNWRKYGFPQKERRFEKGKFMVTNFDDLMDWLEKNQDRWDSRKVKQYALGIEPEWLVEKRKKDAQKSCRPIGTKWTSREDFFLIEHYRKGMTQKEIGEQLGRSTHSVNARVQRLDIWGNGKVKPEWNFKRKMKLMEKENEQNIG